MTDTWVRAARADEVGAVPFTEADGPDGPVLLTRLPGGHVVAFETACPHTSQRLHHGELTDDGCIECPIHFYRYDALTGRNVFPDIDETDQPLIIFATRQTDDGWVEVGPALPASTDAGSGGQSA